MVYLDDQYNTRINNLKERVKLEFELENENNNNDKENEVSTGKFDFLNYNTTQKRLIKLKETLRKSAEGQERNSNLNRSYNNQSINNNINNNYNTSNIPEFNSRLTQSLRRKIIKKDNNYNNISNSHNPSKSKINSNSNSKKIKITYKDYNEFVNKYKASKKSELIFTIPKPFPFMKKDYDQRKLKKMEEILEERKKKEDHILQFRFRANELNREIFISEFSNIIEEEKFKRKERTEKLKEKIVQEMKPFSFYENDERKFKEKNLLISNPPQFLPFKANPVPWTSQVNLYDDIIKKSNDLRKIRTEERARETLNNAKLPPRMEMHEKKKKQTEEEMKIMEEANKKKKRSSSAFKVN